MVCNRRLSRSTYNWTMPLVRLSPAAHALYYRRRAHGDRHSTASRNLTNHYLGILHHCLVTAEPYREEIAAAAYIKATENVSPVLVCGTPGTS
jgi:hypothetical protein